MSKAAEWSSRLSRHDSQESVAAFCRREGVSASQYYYWRRRAPRRFVELSVTQASLVVDVGGARINVPAGFDATHLRAVVDALL